jgi:CRP-like cAMP-binding protein
VRTDPFVAKLENFVRFSREERTALLSLLENRGKVLRARQDLLRATDKARTVNIVLEGWAYRYVDLEDGRRQIVSFLLPGDVCDAGLAYLGEVDHSIGAVGDVVVAEVPLQEFEQLEAQIERLNMAMRWSALVEVSVARRWIVNLGQRSAAERLGHLFCEIYYRLAAVGLCSGPSCEFPVTQAQLGEVTGLSSVHVNRSLQHLRARGLITLKEKTLTIHDVDRLARLSLFDPDYLHLRREGAVFDAPPDPD